MRSDMPQVIIERPRGGPRCKQPKGERKRLQRLSVEDQPRREGYGRRWCENRKWQTDLLGPLRRFLRSRVGRPWNKVYAEVCAEIRRESAVQDHLRDHLLQEVSTCVVLIDGVPCSGEGRDYGMPLGRWRGGFYVCPKTGLLRTIKVRSRRKTKTAYRRQT
jgi:hypothetical protein